MNKRDGSKFKVSRMAKMHANQMEDISQVEAGDIFALFGIECSSGDTLTAENLEEQISLSSMHVPDPVISLRIIPKNKKNLDKLQKAMNKFKREDPTFHVNIDEESEEIIISGMGELHLEVYAERLKREFEIPCDLGEPTVNYRETLTGRVDFNYLHKK
jgi:elongation factor G